VSGLSRSCCRQNRRQNVFNRGLCRGALRLFGGVEIIKSTKTPLIYTVSRFNLGGLGALFGRAKPTKAPPVATGLVAGDLNQKVSFVARVLSTSFARALLGLIP